jgi:hypothetical protein
VTALSTSQLPRFKECCSENLRKTALQGGFFVYRARDYDETEWISRFHLACHPIIQSFGVVLTRSRDLLHTHHRALVFYFFDDMYKISG